MGLISGVAGLIGSAISRRKQKKSEREQRRILQGMEDENERLFMNDYYQDMFDDPSSRSYLKRISQTMYDDNAAISNNAVSTGATQENALAQKQAANEVMSDAVNNLVVGHEAKKGEAKQGYLSRKQQLAAGKTDLSQRESVNAGNAAMGFAKSVSDVAEGALAAIPGMGPLGKLGIS